MTALSEALLDGLKAIAQPERAGAMQAYMKSAMPYLGVSAVPLRQVCKRLFADLSYGRGADWQADALAIWRGATFREERYGALALSGIRAAQPFQTMEALGLYEEMIVTGAWWDFVDVVAVHRLIHLLRAEPAAMKRAMLDWAVCDDMWKRRSAILCQLEAKRETDLDLLEACIAPSMDSKEFFLRKAIGWALRHHARTDPAWVAAYVQRHEARLSGLSKREALKHIA
jgi:3-methyladenine DNA glycosylase AlkD